MRFKSQQCQRYSEFAPPLFLAREPLSHYMKTHTNVRSTLRRPTARQFTRSASVPHCCSARDSANRQRDGMCLYWSKHASSFRRAEGVAAAAQHCRVITTVFGSHVPPEYVGSNSVVLIFPSRPPSVCPVMSVFPLLLLLPGNRMHLLLLVGESCLWCHQ